MSELSWWKLSCLFWWQSSGWSVDIHSLRREVSLYRDFCSQALPEKTKNNKFVVAACWINFFSLSLYMFIYSHYRIMCVCPQWRTAAVTGRCVERVQGWCWCLWQPEPPTRCRLRWCLCLQDTCPSPRLKCWSTCLTLQQSPSNQILVRPPRVKPQIFVGVSW